MIGEWARKRGGGRGGLQQQHRPFPWGRQRLLRLEWFQTCGLCGQSWVRQTAWSCPSVASRYTLGMKCGQRTCVSHKECVSVVCGEEKRGEGGCMCTIHLKTKQIRCFGREDRCHLGRTPTVFTRKLLIVKKGEGRGEGGGREEVVNLLLSLGPSMRSARGCCHSIWRIEQARSVH